MKERMIFNTVIHTEHLHPSLSEDRIVNRAKEALVKTLINELVKNNTLKIKTFKKSGKVTLQVKFTLEQERETDEKTQ